MNNTSTKVKTYERANVAFAALDPYIETNVVLPTETKSKLKGMDFVKWGEANDYPEYLLGLSKRVTTLSSVVIGCKDFACGNGWHLTEPLNGMAVDQVNAKGETLDDLAALWFFDLFLYGGFAIQVIRNKGGQIAELHYIDVRFLRTDEEHQTFFYSEDFAKKYCRSQKVLIYPSFFADSKAETSILYFRDTHTQTYPAPRYESAVISCEIESCINQYHLNTVNNGFEGSIIINFNNGIPDDETKEAIEKDVNEKFGGYTNGGRMVISFNKNKDSATTFDVPNVRDYGDRYNTLAKRSRQEIFTAFRANPNLFGIPTENLGFSSEEYDAAFKLFNRTQIRPAQNVLLRALDRILTPENGKHSATFIPFSLDLDGEEANTVKSE